MIHTKILVFAVCLAGTHRAAGLPCHGDYLEREIASLKTTASEMIHQVMMQQFGVEEHIRATGSGFRAPRYSYGVDTFLNMHDHCDRRGLVGFPEVDVVMNGIEFKTRHENYRLIRPKRRGTNVQYQDMIYPQVPPEVLAKGSVEGQVKEMKEWFKAWKNEDDDTRNYKKYFRPVLCYLEAAWMKPTDNIADSIYNGEDVGAADWDELFDMAHFMSYGNYKNPNESFPFLPTTFTEAKNHTHFKHAQWDYRILCHYIKSYITPSSLRLVDDLDTRMRRNLTLDEYDKSRSAHYHFNSEDENVNVDKTKQADLWDSIMSEIPGMDGYNAVLNDDVFGENIISDIMDSDFVELNAAYYHRWYRSERRNEDGVDRGSLLFNDHNVYQALTTHPDVEGNTIGKDCSYDASGNRVCKKYETQKWTYAIPIELIYLTPLHNWNPHKIVDHGADDSEVTKNDRTGHTTHSKAYDGISDNFFYMTPSSFFNGQEVEPNHADTSGGLKGVLNKGGQVTSTRCSGIRTFLPNIDGVGTLRQRYPVARLDVEGNPIWKELTALKQLIMHSDSYQDMFDGVTSLRETAVTLQTKRSENTDQVWKHKHIVKLTREEAIFLKHPKNNGQYITAYTSYDMWHSHTLKITFDRDTLQYLYVQCDGFAEGRMCEDEHPFEFEVLEDHSNWNTADNRSVTFTALGIKNKLIRDGVYSKDDFSYRHNVGILYNHTSALYNYIGCNGLSDNMKCEVFNVTAINPLEDDDFTFESLLE